MDGLIPPEVAVEQMPKEVVRKDSRFALSFKPVMGENSLERVLLVVSDITAELAARAADAVQREQIRTFERVMRDRSGFVEFFNEARSLAERIRDGKFENETEELRVVHTLKGNAAIFDVTSVANAAHQYEQAVIDRDWARVSEQAKKRGLPARNRQDLVQALFAVGVSTVSAVTATSGRGVGMAEVAAACKQLDGTVSVESELGKGTRFTFSFPIIEWKTIGQLPSMSVRPLSQRAQRDASTEKS